MMLVTHDEGTSKLGRAIAYILSLVPDGAAEAEQVSEVPLAVSGASSSKQVVETPPSTVG